MTIAFVDSNGSRVMIIDMGSEVNTVTKMSTQVCNFIDLLCNRLGWHWEPAKQPDTYSRILSYKELKDAING